MSWSTAGRNRRADATAALIANVSMHTGDPGGSGTSNEWSGNGYARLSPSFAAATGGVASLTAPLEFVGPASSAAAYIGLWASDNTFLGSRQRVSGDANANAAGQYNVNSLNIDAQGTIS